MSDAASSSPALGSPGLGPAELTAWLRRAASLLEAARGELNDLDAAIGDADHGTNMARGSAAVVAALEGQDLPDVEALLKKVGMTLVSSVGGASGPLYGTFFLRMGTAQPGAASLDADALLTALQAGVGGIEQRGKAAAGEKTMLDAWLPALDAVEQALAGGAALPDSVSAGARAAAAGRDATAPLQATKGRASYLGERSIGHVDPGAASTAFLWQALADTLDPASDPGTVPSQEATP